MDSDTSWHKFGELLDLWQVSVDLVEPLNLLLYKFFDQPLRVTIGEVNLRVKLFCELGAAGPAESEDNWGKQIHFLNGKQCLFEVRLFLSVDALTAPSTVWTSGSTGFHRFCNYFFDGVFFRLENFFFEIDLFLLSKIIKVLLGYRLLIVAALLRIIFFRNRLVFEDTSLFGAVFKSL